MTLPTGATINFTWTTFADATGDRNRWLNTRVSGGGTWTYAPATGCGANCQTVTVTRPSGDQTVYTYTLNRGAWNTFVKTYTGGSSTGTLLMTVQKDWDLSLTGPGSRGYYVRLTSATTTMPDPAADSTRRTTLCHEA